MQSAYRCWYAFARAILNAGLREHDNFADRRMWLEVLCSMADITSQEYFRIFHYIYGPGGE